MLQIELTQEQRRIAILIEVEYKLTIMKQYLSKTDVHFYTLLLDKYSTLLEFDTIMAKHQAAFS